MAARPPCLADSNTREISLSLLPNEDGSNPHQEYYSDQSLQQQQTPPTTLSCARCERIVGDSSAFLFVTHQMGTVTLDRVVSAEIGAGGLKTSPEGEWDEFWYGGHVTPPARGGIRVEWRLYIERDAVISKISRAGNVPLHSGRCTLPQPRSFLLYSQIYPFSLFSRPPPANPSTRSSRGKNTLNISALSFYQHGSDSPSLPIAATNEIYAQLHPSPDSLIDSIDRVETMCVVLREEQMIIIRELMKLAAETGVCVDLEDGGAGGETLRIGDGWKETTQALDGHLENTECDVGENEKAREAVVRLELGEEMVPKETKGKGKPGKGKGRLSTGGLPTVSPQNEKKPQRAPPPPSVAVGKRKRGSGPVDPVVATAGKHVDPVALEMDFESPPPRPQPRYKPQKEVPNSQSTGEEEADVEPAKNPPKRGGFDSYGEYEEEEGTTDEEEEVNAIKSPAQKKKKAVAIPKKGVSRRVSHPRKVHK